MDIMIFMFMFSVYVDANDDCNELAFQLGGSSSVNRQWSIKVISGHFDFKLPSIATISVH